MTNFEKWKKDLTPKNLMREGYHAGVAHQALALSCEVCPVDNCPRKDKSFRGHDAICHDQFMEWAGEKVPPEETKDDSDAFADWEKG